MRISKVIYFKTFPNGVFWEKIGVEADLNEGDDPRKALYECKKTVSDFHYESNKAAEKELTAKAEKVAESSPKSQTETIIMDIGTCTEIKTLEAYKLIAKNNPEIKTAYDNQLKKLQK